MKKYWLSISFIFNFASPVVQFFHVFGTTVYEYPLVIVLGGNSTNGLSAIYFEGIRRIIVSWFFLNPPQKNSYSAYSR